MNKDINKNDKNMKKLKYDKAMPVNRPWRPTEL
jgi:hypothetical protein